MGWLVGLVTALFGGSPGVIPGLVEVAKILGGVFIEALRTVMRPMELLFGLLRDGIGVLERIATVLVGAWIEAFKTVARLIENLTAIFVGGFLVALELVTGFFERLATIIGGVLIEALTIVAPLFDRWLGIVEKVVDMVWSLVKAIIGGSPGLIPAFDDVIEVVQTVIRWFGNIGQTILDALKSVGKFIAGVPKALAGLAKKLWDVGVAALKRFGEAIAQGWDAVYKFFTGLPQKAWDAVQDLAQKLWDVATDALKRMLEGVTTGWAAVYNFFSGLPGKAWEAVKGLAQKMWNAAQEAMRRMLEGVTAGWEAVSRSSPACPKWSGTCSAAWPRSCGTRARTPCTRWARAWRRAGRR